jgi:hypothetical protein
MTLTPEVINAIIAGLSVGGGLYGITNLKGLWAKVRPYIPGNPLATTPSNDLDVVLAAVRKVKEKSLDKPCAIRTPVLAECDSFEATVRNLYAEDASS